MFKKIRVLNKLTKVFLCCFSFFVVLISFVLVTNHLSADASELVSVEYPFGGEVLDDSMVPENDKVATLAADEELPTQVDLSATKYFPPIRSQGVNSSCAAWTTTYYQYTYEVAHLNNWDAKHDDSKIFSPKYVWNYLNGGVDGGLTKTACYDFLKEQSSVRWSEFPQNAASVELDWYQGANSSVTAAALYQAQQTRLADYRCLWFANGSTTGTFITDATDSDLNHMKELLSNDKVLSISTECGIYHYLLGENGEYAVVAGEPTGGAHGLTIVGFDDSFRCDFNGDRVYEPFEYGAFKVANSWGSNREYHNGGYFWLMYDALNPVSRLPKQNTSNEVVNAITSENRIQFIYSNIYYYIEVENVQPELMVEVTLGQEVRNDIEVSLSSYQQYNPGMKNDRPTFLSGVGGPLDFGGSSENAYGTRTFLFDYGDLYIGENYEYQVTIKDCVAGNSATNILSIRWLDANGNVIRNLGNQGSVNGDNKTFSWDDHGDGFSVATPITLHSISDGVGAIERVGDSDVFEFIPSTTGKYLFYTIGDLDTLGYLYDTEGEEALTSGDDEWLEGNNFALTQTLTAGQTYYIEVTAYGTNTGSYTLLVCKDFYSSALASTNQDARRVQMQFETSPIYNQLQLRFRNTDYFINKPTANYFEGTYSDGTKIRATVSPSGNGLSMVWYLQIKMSPTSVGMTDSFTATFTTDYLSDELENTLTGLVAYDSSVVTGVSEKSANSLQLLVNSLTTTGHSLTVYNWDNSEVLVTSTIKAATGMKIVKRNSSNQIVEVFYVVVYGDVTGAGDVNLLGNGDIGADDAMEILKETVGKVEFVGLATIAADADHDGEVGSNDALEINKDVVGKTTINQNVAVTTVPDDCYFLTPVIFA